MKKRILLTFKINRHVTVTFSVKSKRRIQHTQLPYLIYIIKIKKIRKNDTKSYIYVYLHMYITYYYYYYIPTYYYIYFFTFYILYTNIYSLLKNKI